MTNAERQDRLIAAIERLTVTLERHERWLEEAT